MDNYDGPYFSAVPMPMAEMLELLNGPRQSLAIGGREVNITWKDDGTCLVWCMCRALAAIVRFRLTYEQVEKLLLPPSERGLLRDVMPDVDPQLRELFISGCTPAEHDFLVLKKLQPAEAYEKLGYLLRE